MVTVGLLLRIEAKPEKVDEVEAMLAAAVKKVQEEDATIVWLAVRLGPTSFAVVDAFPNEAARQAHLAGIDALAQVADELFSQPPSIEHADVIAAKLPEPISMTAK
jgi:quinol monooxygenase YgiN